MNWNETFAFWRTAFGALLAFFGLIAVAVLLAWVHPALFFVGLFVAPVILAGLMWGWSDLER